MDAATIRSPRGIDLAAEKPFRVGRATIDPLSRNARFEGGEERLQPQNLKVLIALARDRGNVVTRDRLVNLCWDGRFIGDDVINRAISTLRHFAERAGGFEITTVPRSGYRLIENQSSRLSRRWMIATAASIALALGAIAMLEWTGRESARPMPTIAILPFTTASADPQARELATLSGRGTTHALFFRSGARAFRTRLVGSSPVRSLRRQCSERRPGGGRSPIKLWSAEVGDSDGGGDVEDGDDVSNPADLLASLDHAGQMLKPIYMRCGHQRRPGFEVREHGLEGRRQLRSF